MLFFHGTTNHHAESIKKQGLLPITENSYLLKQNTPLGPHTTHSENGQIYLTARKDVATVFAKFRVSYERAKPSQKLLSVTTIIEKESVVVDDTAQPAIITFNLQEFAIAEYMKADEHARGMEAYEICKPLPPDTILSVEILDYNPDEPLGVGI